MFAKLHLLITKESESEVAQSCPTLCDPMECSLPGSSVRSVFQARVLEWVAISVCRVSSWPRDRTQVSRIVSKMLYCLSHQGWGELIIREFGMDIQTLLYLKWITNKDLRIAQGTLLNGMWKPGWRSLLENGYMDIWLSPSAVRLKLPQHCLVNRLWKPKC